MKVKLHIPRLPIFEARRVFGRFLPHLRPHRWQLILGGICLLGTAGAELARPWPLKIVLDYVLIPGDPSKDKSFLAVLHTLSTTELLILTSAALLGVAVFAGLVNYGQRILLTGVGHRVAGALRLDLFTHVQQLPQSYHDYRQTGDLMARMTGDISLLKDLLVSLVLKLGSRILIVAGMLFAMIRMQPTLTLVALGVIPALFVANLHFSTRIKDASRRQRKKAGELASTLHENIASIGLVRAYTQERRQRKKFSQRVSSDVKAGLKIVRLEVSFSRTVE
ncbi:MAG TPA: ABC transporter transmembrane domain-containing protein, partial [candidate division Zixibacteria bacterium]|nr:ABC transporter transmembrane domain-containing protein [candidate division Zixibacteria bacterium]